MPPHEEPKQRHEYWPFGWAGSVWTQAIFLGLFVGVPAISALAGPHPWAATGAVLFLAGGTWGLVMRRRYGWLRSVVMAKTQVPTLVCWAAISPALGLIYLATNDNSYRRMALGGLLFTIPSLLGLFAFSRPNIRARLLENSDKELRDKERR